MSAARLTIGITTCNRPEALQRCLRSLAVVAHLSPEVLVFDDASATPVSVEIGAWDLPVPVRVLRDDSAPAYIVGRNRMVREASASAVFLMDDDAAFLGAEALEAALGVLDADREIGAVAFAQCELGGARWDEGHAAQPQPRGLLRALVHRLCASASPRRLHGRWRVSGFVRVLGEEKEFCLRLIDAGYRTVYLPDALVIHQPDQGGRSQQRYLRYVTRNDCLSALYNEPLHRLAWSGASSLGALLPHAPGVEDRRPMGLGLGPAGAVEQRRFHLPRSKGGVTGDHRGLEAPSEDAGAVRWEV